MIEFLFRMCDFDIGILYDLKICGKVSFGGCGVMFCDVVIFVGGCGYVVESEDVIDCEYGYVKFVC